MRPRLALLSTLALVVAAGLLVAAGVRMLPTRDEATGMERRVAYVESLRRGEKVIEAGQAVGLLRATVAMHRDEAERRRRLAPWMFAAAVLTLAGAGGQLLARRPRTGAPAGVRPA